MRFGVSSRTDKINILILIEAVERKVDTSQVNVYDYLNMTDQEVDKLLHDKGLQMKVIL